VVAGTPRPLPLERPRPGDQPPVPPQDRVRRHDGRHLPQDPSTEALTLRRKPSALVVGQPNAPPLQLLLENAVLLHQVLDDLLLVAVDRLTHPARVTSSSRKGERSAVIDRSYSASFWPMYKDRLGRVFGHYGVDPNARGRALGLGRPRVAAVIGGARERLLRVRVVDPAVADCALLAARGARKHGRRSVPMPSSPSRSRSGCPRRRGTGASTARNELRRGLEVIESGETIAGANAFAGGQGRHGAF